jgi:hypothetical protein
MNKYVIFFILFFEIRCNLSRTSNNKINSFDENIITTSCSEDSIEMNCYLYPSKYEININLKNNSNDTIFFLLPKLYGVSKYITNRNYNMDTINKILLRSFIHSSASIFKMEIDYLESQKDVNMVIDFKNDIENDFHVNPKIVYDMKYIECNLMYYKKGQLKTHSYGGFLGEDIYMVENIDYNANSSILKCINHTDIFIMSLRDSILYEEMKRYLKITDSTDLD